MKCTKIQIPVGREMVCAEVPEPVSVIRPQEIPGAADAGIEIERALANPIGSPRLCELARGKKSAAIVVNDITRPYPGGLMVEGLAKELHLAGLSDDRIFLVVAYGHHRFNTEEELRERFGEEVVRRFRIVHHDAMDADKLVTVGRTSAGIDVEINRDFAQAEVKILTGCITPHQLAGYSGGRKSVLPGISGMKTLKKHHSFPIRPETTSLGWLQGNPFHEQSLEAARIAGVDFILNSVDNYKKEVVRCVAGELNEAHLEGVKLCREIWGVHMPQKPDVVIVSPGGYPRDFDLHQSQKAVGCAEVLCREGGTIILCAEMKDGIGRPGKVLQEASSPEEVIETFRREGYTPYANSKAYMWARAIRRFRIIIAQSSLSQEEVESMFMEYAPTVQEAVDRTVRGKEGKLHFCVVPYGSDIVIKEEENL